LRGGGGIERRRNDDLDARDIATDLRPRFRAVGRLEQELIGVVERAWIGLRENQRLGPVAARGLR